MSDTDISRVIQENLSTVLSDIARVCKRVNRASVEVKLVAVTKYAEWKWVEALAEIHSTFGENRPQQLAERCVLLPHIQWHLIGQLQRNKAQQAVQTAALIHSVDSDKLLHKIASVAEEMNVRPDVLLQVNVSGEQSKSGFAPNELLSLWMHLQQYAPLVNVVGLMTMAPASDNPEEARATFRGLCKLRDSINCQQIESTWNLSQLSMGMSGDFEVAIEEGATLVRIGSRLFEGLASAEG